MKNNVNEILADALLHYNKTLFQQKEIHRAIKIQKLCKYKFLFFVLLALGIAFAVSLVYVCFIMVYHELPIDITIYRIIDI